MSYIQEYTLDATSSLCAVAAAEMACCSIFDSPDPKTRSANLGGAVFYGLCAANVLPGASHAGSFIFSVYSLQKEAQDSYITAKIVGTSLETLNKTAIESMKAIMTLSKPIFTDIVFPAGRFVVEDVVVPLAEIVIVPIAQGVVRACSSALRNIVLPMNPAWYASAFLVAGGMFYRGAAKALR